MSTFAYGSLTAAREASAPGRSTTDQPPGIKTFVDTLTALVPAEVLIAHAAIVSMATTTTENADGEAVTTVTDPGTLKWSFYALLVTSVLLYLFGRGKKLEPWDAARMVIPAAAFAGWTMLQRATAFDALAPGMSTGSRYAIAIIGALILGAIARALAYKADQTTPAGA